MSWRIIHADCREAMAAMEAESIDAVVTDPPAGISFMSKHWDRDHGGRDEWVAMMSDIFREMVRVMKPGAHALVWSIPRTSHWTATALENAGLEVRDCVVHLFGSGFPKSLDVSKAIDKAAGAKREVIGTHTGSGYTKANVEQGAQGRETWEWDKLAPAPATDAARRWQGYGTALKPAAEFWWLCRKPLAERNVAANVVKHGTGAVNVDGCRVAGVKPQVTQDINSNPSSFAVAKERRVSGDPTEGRWPANLVLSHTEDCREVGTRRVKGTGRTVSSGSASWDCSPDCPVRLLDEQSGERRSAGEYTKGAVGFHPDTGKRGAAPFGVDGLSSATYGDTGGASRFFYCAKASRSERGEGNNHPTVKSLDLMQWLCRLITPPGGTVLDPFAGSGSTGIAALREKFSFIGIEREAEYVEIAKRRIRQDSPLFNPSCEAA